MASLFGHGLVGFTLTKIASAKTSKLLLFLAIGSAIFPDLDVVTFGKIPYSHPFGHRGFTHSIVFAVIWAAILAFIFTKTKRKLFFIVLFLSTISHGILDALTTGGKGVGFLIPFNNDRFFFPWKVIKVSPIGISKFFSSWGMEVILSELKYIGIPCLIVLLFLHFKRKTNEH
ncbi:metal-dependent hydrolase [Lacinutrix jangbogonensis]|uniref:metal-dependent hydrolase n=1 Tax=Lacinutrix jangbogonensis TaxID=1469557 RepID=UPI00053EF0BC|nr:metal-dependent hydrolase [Lacinutrix jangbogonensis]